MSDHGLHATGPLADVRVIDLTQMLAGPYATMVMADLGADVVKIEPPDGEVTRGHQPHLVDGESYGGYFQSINRNKRSMVLDLKSGSGRRALERLVEDADVLVENYREGTMERLGVAYESLREQNEGLVYASVRGFGDPRGGESPYADRPAFDIIAQAMGGLMSITGTEESGPIKAGPGVGDVFPGVLSVVGILSALRERDRTGEGQYVDVGMVDSVLALCERIVHQYSHAGDVPGPQGNTHPLLFPFDRFETRDGYVMIAAPNDNHWRSLSNLMDRPDLAEDHPTIDDRLEAADELRSVIGDWTRNYTKEELFDLLGDEVPCGPVNTVEDVFQSDHFASRRMLATVQHPDTGEAVEVAGRPIKLPESEMGTFRRAPLLGEHTREVLSGAGYAPEEIDALIRDGVTQTPDDP